MPLHTLVKLVRTRKRVGRGIGSRGAKSGRGQKGQKSRAGSHRKAGFEGGQTPLYMRLPKGRGSKQKFPSQVAKPYALSTRALRRFSVGAIVGPGQVRKVGLMPRGYDELKLVGGAPLTHKLTVRVHMATAQAREQVEAGGGKIEIIARK